jgi:hypothetical protein
LQTWYLDVICENVGGKGLQVIGRTAYCHFMPPSDAKSANVVKINSFRPVVSAAASTAVMPVMISVFMSGTAGFFWVSQKSVIINTTSAPAKAASMDHLSKISAWTSWIPGTAVPARLVSGGILSRL